MADMIVFMIVLLLFLVGRSAARSVHVVLFASAERRIHVPVIVSDIPAAWLNAAVRNWVTLEDVGRRGAHHPRLRASRQRSQARMRRALVSSLLEGLEGL
jgi:hypothetical protein